MNHPPRRFRRFAAALSGALLISTLSPITPLTGAAAAQEAADQAITESVIVDGESWAYLDTGIDPGPTWATAGFDDGPAGANWATGNGQFGYGDGDETTIINYGPDPENKYATTYFRKTITLADTHQLEAATAQLTYDDGAAIYINGTRVLATENLPAGFGHNTWANANREETIPVTIDPTLFVDGDNLIAVEIHQAWRKSNDISFDLALTVDRNDDPRPPSVADDAASTAKNTPVSGDVAANDDAGLTYTTDTTVDPAIGTFTLNTDGTWSLDPATDYFGQITVPHTACDAADVCSEAVLDIEVLTSIWDDEVIADGDTWAYLDTGIYPGSTWATAGFDDGPGGANWATGNGQFGYGDGDETTVISYGPDPQNKHATTYYRKTVTITDLHQIVAAEASLTYDDGAAIYINGTRVLATENLPAGFGHNTWANANREETIPVTIDPTLFVDGDNLIAVEVHQAWRKSNDTSFDLSLTVSRDDIPRPPTVADDEAETDEAVAVAGDVATNDDAGLTYSTDTTVDPAIGTFSLNTDGTWSFDPAAGFLGTVVVPHAACDAADVCSDATLTIVVDVVGDLFYETPIADGDTWAYLDTGIYPGSTWATAGFDDGPGGANWATGNGQFGYGDGDETTIISYGPDPQNKHATTYYRKTITLVDTFQYTDVSGALTYDDAAVVYLNGAEIYNSGNLPAGFGHGTWATSNREETVTFTIDPKLLIDGDNTIAVEVHQAWRKSNDTSFDLRLDATRHVLPGPPAPTVLNETVATPPEVPVSGDVSTNERANDDTVPTWVIDPADLPDEATEGQLVLADDGSFTFTPAAGFTGTLAVPYQACNIDVCGGGTLSIVVIDGADGTPGLLTATDLGSQTLPIGLPIDDPIDSTALETAAQLVDGDNVDGDNVDGDNVDGDNAADAVEWTTTGLPPGITLGDDGLLTGTPTQGGTFGVTLYLVDTAGLVDPQTGATVQRHALITLELVIDDSALITRSLGLADPVHIEPMPDTTVTVDDVVDIAIGFQATDGILGYQWLPPGLTGTFDGRIVGAPTEAGVWVSTVNLVDLAGNATSETIKLTVLAGPPAGLPTEHLPVDVSTLEIRPARNQHGVLGFNANDTSVADVRVWDMQQVGPYMYVGGEFQQVQEGDDGAIVDQSYLARFDIATGAYDPTFTPALDGNVHALEVSPSGLLLVGGEFTAIDGVTNTAGLAAIDPTTGLVDTSFRASVERPWSNIVAIVREIEVVGDLLYVGGNFSHIRDSQTGARSRFYKLARVDATTGQPDLTWKPQVTGGAVYGIGVDQDRGRVLISGSFSAVAAVAGTHRVAIVDTVTATVVPHTMPATAWTVFDIEYANDMIFLGNGWNNQVTVHDADDFTLFHQYHGDGDFQFVEKIGDHIFAGCHCTEDPAFRIVRMLDATTGLEVDIAFNMGGHIDGAWAVATDDQGCAWFGGDIWDGGFNIGTVWARGYARFCAPAW